MDEKDCNGFHRSLQAEGNCNALWSQGQYGVPTIWSFNSYHHCVGCNSPSLDIQHKSTPKVKCNYKANPPMKKIENQVAYLEKMQLVLVGKLEEMGNWKEETPPAMVNLTFFAWKESVRNYFFGVSICEKTGKTKVENTKIYNTIKQAEEERVKNDENNVFKCPNQEKIQRLLTILGPLFRVGTLESTSWKEDYPKIPCYFVFPDSRPKWRIDESMSLLLYDNRFDLSGNNLTLEVEMIANESDHCHIAKFLDIEVQSSDLQKDNIYHYLLDIAQCGFNHIIIIGSYYCDLFFLDCYERVFRWEAMTNMLWFFGSFFTVISENPENPAPWGVSLDGTVWELSDSVSPEECNPHPINDKKKSKKKGKNKNQKKHH